MKRNIYSGMISLFLILCFSVTLTNASEYGTQLTFTGGKKWFTDWSPDGNWIAYSERGPDGDHDIWIIKSDGSSKINLTPSLIGDLIFPNFTPDSKKVTFANLGPGHDINVGTLKSIDIENLTVTLLRTNAVNGFWSNNENYLVYRRVDNADLYVYDAQNETEWKIADGDPEPRNKGGQYGLSAFTPDNSYVITTYFDGTSPKLFKIPTMGGEMEQVTFNDVDYDHWYPECSPDGEWILYTRFTGDYSLRQLWVYNTITNQTIQLFPDLEYQHWSGSFSPDGSKLSYLIDIEGSNEVFIADFNIQPFLTLNSPNGGEVLVAGSPYQITWESFGVETINIEYLSNGVWNTIVNNIDVATGSYEWTVPTNPLSDCVVRISDASDPSIFDKRDVPFTIFEMTPEYGTRITFDGGGKWFTDWSPDGELITYRSNDNAYIISSNGGEPRNLTENFEDAGVFPSFTYNSKEITFNQGNHNEGFSIVKMNIETGAHQILLNDACNGFWSNNGQYLVHASLDGNQLILYDVINDIKTIIAQENYRWGPSCFGPDDSYVVTCLMNGGSSSLEPWEVDNERLYKIQLDGGEPEQLTFHDGSHWMPNCSPDGEWILYTNYVGGSTANQELWVCNTITNNSIQLFPEYDGNVWSGSFSPDGTKFCYLLQTEYGGDNWSTKGYDLFVADFPFESQVITAISETIEEIQELNLGNKESTSLTAELDGTVKKLNEGNNQAAINKLNVYINNIEALHGKEIDEVQADELIETAQDIISVISKSEFVGISEISMEDVVETDELPKTYSLSQNRPNPFNSSTYIQYNIPTDKSGYVELNVYDLRGGLVKTLVNKAQSPGHYSVLWDGADDSGRRVSSGIYLYRLQTSAFTKTRKMMLLR